MVDGNDEKKEEKEKEDRRLGRQLCCLSSLYEMRIHFEARSIPARQASNPQINLWVRYIHILILVKIQSGNFIIIMQPDRWNSDNNRLKVDIE